MRRIGKMLPPPDEHEEAEGDDVSQSGGDDAERGLLDADDAQDRQQAPAADDEPVEPDEAAVPEPGERRRQRQHAEVKVPGSRRDDDPAERDGEAHGERAEEQHQDDLAKHRRPGKQQEGAEAAEQEGEDEGDGDRDADRLDREPLAHRLRRRRDDEGEAGRASPRRPGAAPRSRPRRTAPQRRSSQRTSKRVSIASKECVAASMSSGHVGRRLDQVEGACAELLRGRIAIWLDISPTGAAGGAGAAGRRHRRRVPAGVMAGASLSLTKARPASSFGTSMITRIGGAAGGVCCAMAAMRPPDSIMQSQRSHAAHRRFPDERHECSRAGDARVRPRAAISGSCGAASRGKAPERRGSSATSTIRA